MRSSFTPEETDAILAKHYPWVVKGNIVFKCIECDFETVGDEGDTCETCMDCCEADEAEEWNED